MKNSIKTLLYTIAGLLIIISCDNDLNPTVYSSVTEETYEFTEDDLYGSLGTVYSNMRSWWTHWDYYMAQEISTDELVMPANPSGWDDGGIYRNMHLHNWNSLSVPIPRIWNKFYQGVFYTNRVIEQIENGILPISTKKEEILAELRVARAFHYWLIMDNFGDAPLVTTTSQELPEKTSREELYNFVVDELTWSMSQLSEDSDTRMYGRFNKWAAKALLANVYLNSETYIGEGKWEECIEQTDDIINSGRYTLETDYRDIFKTENSGSPEIIFAIPFDENLGTGFYVQKFSWHAALAKRYALQSTLWGPGSTKGITQFIDTYDTEDTRLSDTWLSGPQYDSEGNPLTGSFDQAGQPLVFTKELPSGVFTGEAEGYRMNKFEVKQGAQFNLSNDFPFFRYSQVLMMKAESLLRTGGADEAAILVTQVRQRAFKETPEQAVVTGNELTEDSGYDYGYIEDYVIVDEGNTDPVPFGRFLDELGWEFAWEGHRRRDMIRFGGFHKKKLVVPQAQWGLPNRFSDSTGYDQRQSQP